MNSRSSGYKYLDVVSMAQATSLFAMSANNKVLFCARVFYVDNTSTCDVEGALKTC